MVYVNTQTHLLKSRHDYISKTHLACKTTTEKQIKAIDEASNKTKL